MSETGIDGLLVDRIARRYTAYARYTAAQGRPVLPLPEWFAFYAVENADQINADQTTPDACSVTTDAIGAPRADRSRALLEALRQVLSTNFT